MEECQGGEGGESGGVKGEKDKAIEKNEILLL